ncbi:hypothetical protein [Bosea sp. BK604]|uniref:hypothetical protein n=1 Tax=Bosea sp. BK604 TaxID=2512180 RepID=UPI00105324CE|nr:hypothetical protein [Bosea sp. BK604]
MVESEVKPACGTDEERRAALRRFVNIFKASRPEGTRLTFEVSTTDLDAALAFVLKEPGMLFVVRDDTGAGQGITTDQLKVAPQPPPGVTEADEIKALRRTLGRLA